MKRTSFKVLLGPSGTPLDRYLEAMARQYLVNWIAELPGHIAVVRELSVLIGMEPSRVRRLLNDLGIVVNSRRPDRRVRNIALEVDL